MNKKKLMLICCIGVLAVAGGAGVWFALRPQTPAKPLTGAVVKAPSGKPAGDTVKPAKSAVTNSAAKAAAKKAAKAEKDAEDEDDIPASLQPLVDKLEAAVEDDKYKQIVALAQKLLESDSPAARRKAADALDFAGWEGLGLITTLLLDNDAEVAESARNAFESKLSDMENVKMKQQLIANAAEAAANVDPDYFETLLSDYAFEATDYQILDQALSLYNDKLPQESKQAIFEAIDNVICAEDDIKNIDYARQEITKWKAENPPEEGDNE